ncbi:MAG: HD domain-containing protein [Nitrospirae bacterium]|nr:HD domain-containing protein [Nitrospirota bacterium]
MNVLILPHPVHTLDKQMLLPAGSTLSEETLSALIASNADSPYRKQSLLDHGSARKDLFTFFKQAHYSTIFSTQEENSEFLNLMGRIRLPLPVLQSLDYFKKHDYYTYRHILMVFALSSLLSGSLVPDYQDRIKEATSGPFHDIGKICVPLHILKKPTPLTLSELNFIKYHALAGYVLLSYYLRDTRNFFAIIARDHHERNDGSGYPRGILLKDRMVEIVAASDIYDALISPRPYRATPYDNRTALEEITSLAEKNKISWDIVKALVAYNRKTHPHYSECIVSSEKRGTPPPDNVHNIIDDEKPYME